MSDLTVASLGNLSESELIIEGFLARYRGNTLHGYKTDLRMFKRWCDDNELDLLTIKRVHLDLFMRYMAEECGHSKATVYRRINAVKSMYLYAAEEDFIDKSPARALHPPRPNWGELPPVALTPSEFQQLLAAAVNPVDHALVAILGYLGLRITEALSIDVGDYDEIHDGHRIVRFVGKGDVPAMAPVSDALYEIICAAAGDRTEGPLLAREDGSRMPRRTACRVLDRLSKAAGLTKRVTPHCLRHTFVVSAIDAGVHMRVIQLAARHKDISTTVIYDRQRQVPMSKHAAHDVAAFLDKDAS